MMKMRGKPGRLGGYLWPQAGTIESKDFMLIKISGAI